MPSSSKTALCSRSSSFSLVSCVFFVKSNVMTLNTAASKLSGLTFEGKACEKTCMLLVIDVPQLILS